MILGNGDLPEGEGVCINMLDCDLLVLGGVSKSADRLRAGNFDLKYLASIVSEHPAVELERGSHDVLFRQGENAKVQIPTSTMSPISLPVTPPLGVLGIIQ
jgi:hypothetical protein